MISNIVPYLVAIRSEINFIKKHPKRMHTSTEVLQRLYVQFSGLVNKLCQKFEVLILSETNSFATRLRKQINVLIASQKIVTDTHDVYVGRKSEAKYSGDSPFYYTGEKIVRRQDLNEAWVLRMITLLTDLLLKTDQTNPNDHLEMRLMFRQYILYSLFFQYAVVYDRNDMFNFQRSHPSWDVANSIIAKVYLPPTLKQTTKKVHNYIRTGVAIISRTYRPTNSFARDMKMAFRFFIMDLNKKKFLQGDLDCKQQMDDMRADSLANGNERGAPRLFVKAFLPRIGYKKKVYIRKMYPRLTEKSIIRWVKGQTPNLVLEQAMLPPQQITNTDIFKKNDSRIRIRVMAPFEFLKGNSQIKNDHDFIIFHIHGGGYIGQSSFSHQTYTRRWVQTNRIPVISVDYCKPPMFPYPSPLDDCWQTYNWIVYESHKYFSLRQDKKIILAGDSAGGNLILCLTNLIIMMGAPMPYYLLPFYPCSSLHVSRFSPCYLLTVDDPMLSTELLGYCLRAYVPAKRGFSTEKDYLLSPMYTPDAILQRYPPLRFFIGTFDPLHDDTVRLGVRLRMNGIDVKIIEYQGLMHGFMSLDLPGFLKEARQCVVDSIFCIEDIIRPSIPIGDLVITPNT